MTIDELLKRKNLREDLFSQPAAPSFEDDLNDHANWLFDNIYSIPYPRARELAEAKRVKIARYFHGITHVSYAAYYVTVFANLYRRYGDIEAQALTNEDLKLLQLAALFHDSAREDENEDRWDHESGILLYYYLTQTLEVDHLKAKLIAEAAANKDAKPGKGYFEINKDKDGSLTYQFVTNPRPKNIYQKIIQNVDCLEINRARPHYDATYLDFYHDIAKTEPLAHEEMAQLITEARSLIYRRGDAYSRTKPELKKAYEGQDIFPKILADVHDKDYDYRILPVLGEGLLAVEEAEQLTLLDLEPYSLEAGITESNLQRAMREGKLLVRGVATPSAIHQEGESLAELELRKTMRELGVPTRSAKISNTTKDCNPVRSTSLITHGSIVYTDAGFLITPPDPAAISQVSICDINSARGSKKHLSKYKYKDKRPLVGETVRQLTDLRRQLQLGGDKDANTRVVENHYAPDHTEILYDATRYNAIYYSNDPHLNNIYTLNTPYSHPYSPLLQAIYLQNEYKKQYQKSRQYYCELDPQTGLERFEQRYGTEETLPIFEYSSSHNRLRQANPKLLKDDNIVHMWVELCSVYMRNTIAKHLEIDLGKMSIDDIKTLSMYKKIANYHAQQNAPADANYPQELRQRINQEIEKQREELLQTHHSKIVEKLKKGELSVFENEAFFNILAYPKFYQDLNNLLEEAIRLEANSDNLFHFRYGWEEVEYIHSYSEKAKRVYELAKKLNFNDVVENIQNRLIEQIKDDLNKTIERLKKDPCTQKVEFDNATDDIERQIKKLEQYDLSEVLKVELNQLILAYLRHNIKLRKNDKIRTRDHLSFLEFLSKIDALSMECQGLLEKQLKELKCIINNFDYSGLIRYVKAAKNCGIEIESSLFVPWFKNLRKNVYIFRFYFRSQLKSFVSLFSLLEDDNILLFELFLNNASEASGDLYRYFITKKNINLARFSEFCDLIAKMEKLTKGQGFTEAQMQVINKELLKANLYSGYYDSNPATAVNSFLEYVSVLNTLVNLHDDIQIPRELLFCFNHYLKFFANTEDKSRFEQLSVDNINYFKKVHAQLPPDEERNQWMANLVSYKYQSMFPTKSISEIEEYVRKEMAIDLPDKKVDTSDLEKAEEVAEQEPISTVNVEEISEVKIDLPPTEVNPSLVEKEDEKAPVSIIQEPVKQVIEPTPSIPKRYRQQTKGFWANLFNWSFVSSTAGYKELASEKREKKPSISMDEFQTIIGQYRSTSWFSSENSVRSTAMKGLIELAKCANKEKEVPQEITKKQVKQALRRDTGHWFFQDAKHRVHLFQKDEELANGTSTDGVIVNLRDEFSK